VKEYHRLKEEAGKRAAAKLHELDTVSREQKMDQDRLDNEQRQKSDYDAHIKQKENELEESVQRLDKLNEYIKLVTSLFLCARWPKRCGSIFSAPHPFCCSVTAQVLCLQSVGILTGWSINK